MNEAIFSSNVMMELGSPQAGNTPEGSDGEGGTSGFKQELDDDDEDDAKELEVMKSTARRSLVEPSRRDLEPSPSPSCSTLAKNCF